MQLNALICENCGSPLRKEGDLFVCPHCGFTYEAERQEEIAAAIEAALSAEKIEKLANARKLLYDSVHAKYPSKEAVVDNARLVLSIHQDEPLARMYLLSHDEDSYDLIRYLASTNLDSFRAQEVYRWLLPSLNARLVGPLKDFVDRHFQDQEKTKRINEIEEEALRIDEGVYVPTLARDVFLAYSSLDMPSVIHVIDLLEENGLTVFAAFRNMRHGKGAQENYLSVLKEAMASCKSLLFLSSNHSRQMSCDALKVELPHLINNLPKKKRVEYLLNDYSPKMPLMVRKTLKEAFPEQEQCRDEDDLVTRIYDLLNQGDDEEAKKRAQFEEETKKRLEEEYQKKLEEERLALEKEKRAIEEEKRLQQEKAETERRKQEEARLAEEKRRKEQEAADAKRKAEEEAKRPVSEKPKMQSLSCPHCGGIGNYDVKTGIFSCPYCGHKGLLKKEEPKKEVPLALKPAPAPTPAPAPKKTQNQLFQEQYKQKMREALEKQKVYKPGFYIRFGSYPQTASPSLANSLLPNGKKTEDGFFYLPIAWRIIKAVSGVRPYAVLISDRVLDAGTYRDIRDLLNGQSPDSFIQKAFSPEERRCMLPFGNNAKVVLLGNENEKDAFDLLEASASLIADWTPYSQPKAIHDPNIDRHKEHGANYWLYGIRIVNELGEKPPFNQDSRKYSFGFRPMIRVELSYLVAHDIEPVTHSQIEMSEKNLQNELIDSWGAYVETQGRDQGTLLGFFGKSPLTLVFPEGIQSVKPVYWRSIGDGKSSGTFLASKVVLPNTLTTYSPTLSLLATEAYEVRPDHPVFTSENGVLYDKKKTKIIAVPVKYDASMPFPISVVAIGPRAFRHCKLEKALKFPQNLKTIEEEAFGYTSFSGDARLPSGLETVGKEAFSHAQLRDGSLNPGSLFVPGTVKKAESNAFWCSSVKAICLDMRKPLFGLPKGFAKDVFGKTPEEKIIWGYTPKKLADLDEKQKEQMRKDLLENLEHLKKK